MARPSAAPPTRTVGDSLLHRQAAGGNQAVVRLLRSVESAESAKPVEDELEGQIRTERALDGPTPGRPAISTKLTVSDPGDASEREASAVASRVVRHARPRTPALVGAGVAPAVSRLSEPPASGMVGGGPASLGVVESALAGPGEGAPMGLELREAIEPHVGIDLSGVRVKQDGAADAAAKTLGARAFTTGSTIFLAANESPRDLELMAHEATHVAQQHGGGAPQAATLMRDVEATDVIPDFILDAVRSAVRAIPGYTVLTLITGKDLLTDQPVAVDSKELIEQLLTYGPFGASVAQVLQTVNVIGDVVTMVTDGLAAHNLTLARIGQEVDQAWDEMGLTEDNVAIATRHIDAILRDVGAFVQSIVDRVIAMVREVIAEVAEPYLESPEIQPVWSLAKKVFHYDPLRGEEVNAPTVEILADFLRLIGKQDALAQMQERGTLQQTADWLDTQFATFTAIKNDVFALFADAWAAISPQNLPNLLDTLPQLARRAWDLLQRIVSFGATLVAKVLELVKNALLGWLSAHAHEIHGFRMITVIIGQNPFTGEAVPRTAENLIGGFISLLPNGEATYQQLAEAGTITEAASKIENTMSRLGISLEMVVSTFRGIWDSLSLEDLLNPIGAFERIVSQFGEPIKKIIEFVTEVIKVVIELILKLMNFPSDLLGSIITNAMQAIEDIKRDPVAFLQNMLEALKQGFIKFFDDVGTYLLRGLADWLFRGLGALGITAPPDLSLKSILTVVLQVLDITVDKLWTALGKHIGEDRVARMRGAVDQLGGAWAFIKDVQEGGIPAIWKHVTDQLGNLWDSLLSMAREWIMTTIVDRVVAKLVSMLDPTGVMAVVNSMIAFFNAVQSAIEYIRDVLMIVDDYVTTFAAVAAGNVGPGAEKITKGLAAAIPVAIGFLANQVGLGNVPEKVVEIIERIRELVEQAIDWLIGKAIQLGSAALNALTGGGQQQPADGQQPPGAPPGAPTLNIHEPFTSEGHSHELFNREGTDVLMVASNNPTPITAVNDPEGTLRKLHDEYVAAYAKYKDAIAPLAADPNAQTGWSARRDEVNAIVHRIVARVIELRPDSSPGASAPGIGTVAPHKAQLSRLTKEGVRVWWLESEHIVPRGIVDATFIAHGEAGIPAGSAEYNNMHTLLMYEEASDEKTKGDSGDASNISAFSNATREIVATVMASSNPAAHLSFMANTVRNLLNEYSGDAIERTNKEIVNENNKNGARRGPAGSPESPVPGPGKVDEAARKQIADIIRMLEERYERALPTTSAT